LHGVWRQPESLQLGDPDGRSGFRSSAPGHTTVAQSSPSQPGAHVHTPFRHRPRPEQPAGQPRRAHVVPRNGGAHRQAPRTQTPLPEQLCSSCQRREDAPRCESPSRMRKPCQMRKRTQLTRGPQIRRQLTRSVQVRRQLTQGPQVRRRLTHPHAVPLSTRGALPPLVAFALSVLGADAVV
jgi:hypothetical protein